MRVAIRWFFILSLVSPAIVEIFDVSSTGVNAALVVLPLLICFAQYGLAGVRFSLDVLLIAALVLTASIVYFLYGLPTTAGQMRLITYVFFLIFYCFSQLSLLQSYALESVCRTTFLAVSSYMVVADGGYYADFSAALVSKNRFYGLGNPNLHGILAAIGLIAAVYFSRRRSALARLFHWIALALLWLNLWASKSRASWMALAIFSAAFFLLRPGRYKKPAVVLLLLMAPIVYALSPSVDSLSETAGGLRLDGESVSQRSDVTFEAIDMAVRVGYRPFGLGATPILKALTSMNAIDNSYICMMLETGFWGLGIFLIFIVRTTARGLRTCLGSDSGRLRDHHWAFATFIALAAHSMYESFIMSGLQLGSLLFLFCAAQLNRPLASRSMDSAGASLDLAPTGLLVQTPTTAANSFAPNPFFAEIADAFRRKLIQ